MTRAEMYQTVREAMTLGSGIGFTEGLRVLAALEAEEREAAKCCPTCGRYDADPPCTCWYGCKREAEQRRATPPTPPAAEAIVAAFARDFFVRHDHTYSGIEIYEWLKKQVTGPVAPPAAECAAQAALRQVQWCSSDEWQLCPLCPLCDQCEKNGHSPDCLIGAALAAPSRDYAECPRCHVTLYRSATGTHERRHEIREGGEEKP